MIRKVTDFDMNIIVCIIIVLTFSLQSVVKQRGVERKQEGWYLTYNRTSFGGLNCWRVGGKFCLYFKAKQLHPVPMLHVYWRDHIHYTGMIPVRQQMEGSSLGTYRNVVLLPTFTHLPKWFCVCGSVTCSWPKANLDVRVRYELAAFGRRSAVQTSHKGLIHKVPARVLSPACGLPPRLGPDAAAHQPDAARLHSWILTFAFACSWVD